MDLSFLLLTIISRLDGERTIYAGLHLFRGKRSGQTLQDVKYYSLKEFFCILPKLRIELFDEAVTQLKNNGYISIDQDATVHVTEAGWKVVNTLPAYRFNGWDFRGREQIFFARLSLVVQTLSNFKVGQTSFMPVQQDHEVQRFVKRLLVRLPIRDVAFSKQFGEELYQIIVRSGMKDIQKTILTHRLSGYENTGWTWNQLAEELDVNPTTIRLYFIESLHILLEAVGHKHKTSLLNKLTEDIRVSNHLTDSSRKTKRYFENGMSIEKIAEVRRLKVSTIEDHFVEMSINDADFPIERFVSKTDINAVFMKSNELGTKRLRRLKDECPALSYFQLRLILGYQSKGAATWKSIKS